jgi:hypothetical protein
MGRRDVIAALAGAAVVVVFAGGVAWAAIPDASGVLNGCYSERDGSLRLVDSGAECKARELAISWSQQGPKGDKGDKGDRGDQGGQGDPGLDGTNGTNGQDGINGIGVMSETELPGLNCADGGSKFTAANGVTYACDGAQGPQGPPGTSEVLIANVNGTGILVPGGDAIGSAGVGSCEGCQARTNGTSSPAETRKSARTAASSARVSTGVRGETLSGPATATSAPSL